MMNPSNDGWGCGERTLAPVETEQLRNDAALLTMNFDIVMAASVLSSNTG